jgi:hypothetical protein
MKRRFLVVVRAGDRSQHPQWLAQSVARNWDLVVHYHGDDRQRYPASGDGLVRIDGEGPKWPALHKLLTDTRDAWRAYDYIWIPDEHLAASCADINRMFELMAALGIELAQPSLSWDSQVDQVLTLHNPNFALRYSSFVEPTAACFSRPLLERVLPTFGESISGAGLGYVWPRYLQSPATQCAILDRVQVTHTRPASAPSQSFNNNAVDPRAETAHLLKKHGVHDAIQLSYGAIDRDARRYSLFDAETGEFLFRLCEGYLGKLADELAMLGVVFAAHATARAEYLNPATVHASAPASAPAPAAAGAALERFKSALAAAAANSAGRVAAATPG